MEIYGNIVKRSGAYYCPDYNSMVHFTGMSQKWLQLFSLLFCVWKATAELMAYEACWSSLHPDRRWQLLFSHLKTLA